MKRIKGMPYRAEVHSLGDVKVRVVLTRWRRRLVMVEIWKPLTAGVIEEGCMKVAPTYDYTCYKVEP